MVLWANRVVFWANTVVFWANTVVFWANTVVFWANSAGVPLLRTDAVAVAPSCRLAGVLGARQRLEVRLEEPLPPPHLVHTLHAETGRRQVIAAGNIGRNLRAILCLEFLEELWLRSLTRTGS